MILLAGGLVVALNLPADAATGPDWSGSISYTLYRETYPNHLLCTPPSDEGREHAIWREDVTISVPSVAQETFETVPFSADVSYIEDGGTCQPGATVVDAQWHGTARGSLGIFKQDSGAIEFTFSAAPNDVDGLKGLIKDPDHPDGVRTGYSLDLSTSVPSGTSTLNRDLVLNSFADSVSTGDGPSTATVALTTASEPAGPVARFAWTMPKTLTDADNDGLLDYAAPRTRISRSEIEPLGLVDFDGCTSSVGTDDRITSFSWHIDHHTFTTHKCTFRYHYPMLKSGSVSLMISTRSGKSSKVTHSVAPRDLLVVSIGDSYASGEGNPDRHGKYTRIRHRLRPDMLRTDRPAKWKNAKCHASAVGGPARAARQLENADPHSTVTFVQLACSGSTITRGLFHRWKGTEPGGASAPAQMKLLRTIRGLRIPDILTVSIGGNDIKFSKIITDCVTPFGHCTNAEHSATFRANLKKAASNLRKLAICVTRSSTSACSQMGSAGLNIPARNVVVTPYPDLTHAANGSYCGYSPYPHLTITPSEFRWAHNVVLKELNHAVKTSWRRYGVHVATLGSSRTHGICAAHPYFRTVAVSQKLQGYAGRQTRGQLVNLANPKILGDVKGAFHPNAIGTNHIYVPSLFDFMNARTHR